MIMRVICHILDENRDFLVKFRAFRRLSFTLPSTMSAIQLSQLADQKKYLADQIAIAKKRSNTADYMYQQDIIAKQSTMGGIPFFEPLTYTGLLQSLAVASSRTPEIERGTLINKLTQSIASSVAEAEALVKQLKPTEIQSLNDLYGSFVKVVQEKFKGGVSTATLVQFIRQYLKDNVLPGGGNGSTHGSMTGQMIGDAGDQMHSGMSMFGSVGSEAGINDLSTIPDNSSSNELSDLLQDAPGAYNVSSASAFVPKKISMKDKESRIKQAVSNNHELHQEMDTYFQENLGLPKYSKTKLVTRKFVSAEHLNAIFNYVESNYPPDKAEPVTEGRGFFGRPQRRVIHGRGMSDVDVANKRFYINLKKLQEGVLSVHYASTRQYKIKPRAISNAVRDVIMDIVKDKFDQRIYDILKPDEKVTIQYFIRMMQDDSMPVIKDSSLDEMFDHYTNLVEQYDIYQGELASGNSNKAEIQREISEIIPELKRITLKLVQMRRIPVNQANLMMMKLSS